MAHGGHHGYPKTARVRAIRQDRADRVAKASPYRKLNTPAEKLAYLDENFPNGASNQRSKLIAQSKGTQGHHKV